jgi:hypothetical protein
LPILGYCSIRTEESHVKTPVIFAIQDQQSAVLLKKASVMGCQLHSIEPYLRGMTTCGNYKEEVVAYFQEYFDTLFGRQTASVV